VSVQGRQAQVCERAGEGGVVCMCVQGRKVQCVVSMQGEGEEGGALSLPTWLGERRCRWVCVGEGSVWVCERGGVWSEGIRYVDVLEKGVCGWGHWLQCGHMLDF